MKHDDNKPVGSFSIIFGKNGHQVGTEAYAHALLAMTEIINESANELEVGARFELTVNAEKAGSFKAEVYMWAAGLIGTTYPMATYENLKAAKELAKSAFSIATGAINLGKWLKGEKAKEVSIKGDKAIVVNGDNAKITAPTNIYNVYVNQNVQKPLREMYEVLEEDESIDFFRIQSEGIEPAEVRKEQFKELKTTVVPRESKSRTRRIKANLLVVRQSFDPKRKSDFLYAGNTISAHVESSVFWENIDRGERFAKGDKLVTKLEILEVYNETLGAYERKSYRILEVIEHKPRPIDAKLFPVR